MSHLLWKYYWDNDVERFRQILRPNGSSSPSTSPALRAPIPPTYSATPLTGTPPRHTPKARKSSANVGYGPAAGPSPFSSSKSSGVPLGKADLNYRDRAGLTLLLRASSSTNPNAIHFVKALVDHPAIDIYARDLENGWTALHRALYAGNISIARLLLTKERRILTGDATTGGAVNRVGHLIKAKDYEGKSPFELYQSTIGFRALEQSEDATGSDTDSTSSEPEPGPLHHGQSAHFVPGNQCDSGEEFFTFGSNKNLSLGLGDGDDRQYPERANLQRPDFLVRRLYQDSQTREKSLSPITQPKSVDEIPDLVRGSPILIADVVMAKLHTAVLTDDPVANLYLCGIGRGGRLGVGDENTRFKFTPVQGSLAHKKVKRVALGQDHSMAIADDGELWTWGSNKYSQLGYALPAPSKADEDPISTIPRQVFGPMKKEVVLGIAASAVHSVAHTGSSLFCWGRNFGQLGLMDADSRSLEVQQVPRKVGGSLFSSTIVTVSVIEKATTCLLSNHTICIFTSYGYNIVRLPPAEIAPNLRFDVPSGHQNEASRHHPSFVASGGDTIAALTFRGDLFVMKLQNSVDTNASATSTTNPSKIKGAITKPQCIWNGKTDGVRSVSVGENGSVIISTASGAVWRRIRRATSKTVSVSGTTELRKKDFKFQRVPGITNAVAVRSSTFGTFSILRKDCARMTDQMIIDDQRLWSDMAPLLSLKDFKASNRLQHESKRDVLTFKPTESARVLDAVGPISFEFLTSPSLEDDLQYYLTALPRDDDCDAYASTLTAPDIRIPVHSWLLAARSPVLRKGLQRCRSKGEAELTDVVSVQTLSSKIHIVFDDIDILCLVNFVLYTYRDEVVPVWNFTRQAQSLAHYYRQVRSELMKLATKLEMPKLEAAARLQTRVVRSLDQDFRQAIRDPTFFDDGDIILELDGGSVALHSGLACQRCPYFQGLFHGRSEGMWLAGRKEEGSNRVTLDFGHISPKAFHYVTTYLYADAGPELFDETVSTTLDGFPELVMDVLGIADELMLDRLSQICQQTIAKFTTTRNISFLLNEISPYSVAQFKNAGLEYACLHMEAMLENHLLDDLDDELLAELDESVRQNQLAKLPFVRSGQAEAALLGAFPDLQSDIEEERQRLVKEMAWKMTHKDDEKKMSSSLKARDGSLDEGGLFMSPLASRTRRKSKASRNEPFSPNLRPRDSNADLIFDMEEEDCILGSPSTPSIRPLKKSGRSDSSHPLQAPTLHDPEPNPKSLDDFEHSFPTPSPAQFKHGVEKRSPHTGQGNGASPWASGAIPTLKLDMREIMSEASTRSALSAGLAAQERLEASSKATPKKVSQKERKKQQQQQEAATREAELRAIQEQARPAWEKTPSFEKNAAPWKKATETPKSSLKQLMAESSKPPTAATSMAKPLVAFETSGKSTPRRAASPDTRFAGQKRTNSSTALIAAGPSASSSSAAQPQRITPHSKSYIKPTPKAEPVLGLSLADIIGQQEREQEIVREAVAKRSLQEIQQEQAFQEWWDQESRRAQEEESRLQTRGREREGVKETKRGRPSRRGRGRGGAANSDGKADANPSGPQGDGNAGGQGKSNALGRSGKGRSIQA